ncbi:HNH endonuclease [Paraherbaspirillum soli]|uniref:HNH endonuclease n=1 Tax=Paraherbaspirillum soli TaxID=631222 RepID=A0ABW0M9N2_9BURK
MVAVFTGNGLGVQTGSTRRLGSQGQIGDAALGRAGDQMYVNAASGNLFIDRRDELLMGRGPDASLHRTYNSLGELSGGSWQAGGVRRLLPVVGTLGTAGSSVTRIDWDGSQTVYNYNASRGLYVSSDGAGARNTLAYSAADHAWGWTNGSSQATETYADSDGGRISALRDPDGNTVSYSYTAAGLLAQIKAADGDTTNFDYSGTLLTQVHTVTAAAAGSGGSATATRTYYAYDAQGRLSQVTLDLSPDDNSIADGNTFQTSYTYDGSSQRIATISQSDGSRTAFAYQNIGGNYRVIRVDQADDQGNLRSTRLDYDTVARKTTITDPLGAKSVLSYDAQGHLIASSGPAVNGVSQTLTYTYNADGNVASVQDGLQHVVSYTYDANGNLLTQRDQAGDTIQRSYGANNQLLSETVYRQAASGTTAAADGATKRYVYDAQNHLRYAVSGEGRVTEYRYNAAGQQVSVIGYAGAQYDVSALADSSTLGEATLTAWVAALADKSQASRTDTSYDFRGNIAAVTHYAQLLADGSGSSASGDVQRTSYVYDPYGRLLERRAVASDASQVERFSYDGMGRLLSSTDAGGALTLYQIDDAHNRTTVTLANGLTRTSTYNRFGELVGVTEANGSTVLSQTTQVYDAAGRLRQISDNHGPRSYLLYDAAGRKTADISAGGTLTEYRYDADNQLTQTIRYATLVPAATLASLTGADGKPAALTLEQAGVRPAAASTDQREWRLYDSANRLLKVVDAAGAVTDYSYDGTSRLLQTIRRSTTIDLTAFGANPIAANASPAANGADRITRNAYDKDGQLRFVLDGEGYLTEYRYDGAGRNTQTVRYATATSSATQARADWSNVPAVTSANDIVTATVYDARGLVRSRIDGEGYVTDYQYDEAGRLAQSSRGQRWVQGQLTQPGALQRESYRYDADGRLLQSTRTLAGGASESTTLRYDQMGNKLSDTNVERSSAYRYDLQGRLTAALSANGSAALAALGANPDAAKVEAIWQTQGVRYSYDATGLRIGMLDASGNQSRYYYDADGRLTHSINALGEVQETQYDAFGAKTQNIAYGNRLSAAMLAGLNGGLVTQALKDALAQLADPAKDSRSRFDYQANGALSKSTDALGNASSYSYNAFGELTTRQTPIAAGVTALLQTTYDRRGLAVAEVRDAGGLNQSSASQYDAFGRVVASTDANGVSRSRSYDRNGRVVTQTDGLNQVATTSYDAFDNVLSQTDKLGKTTQYSYTAFNRQITMTTPEGVSTVRSYNAHGQQIALQDGNGNSTTYAYDLDGNLLTTTTAAGSLNLTTSHAYDASDRLIQSTDGNGKQVTYSYDAANRLLTRQLDPNGLNLVTSYQYDAKGQQVSSTDASGIVTQIQFDLKGQQVSQIVDPAGLHLTTQYSYDATGHVLSVTNPNGGVTQYVYDALGRRIEQHVDASGLNLTTRTAYDKTGNPVAVTDPNGNVTRYVYDANDRLVFTIDGQGGVSQNFFDANGNLTQVTKYATPIGIALPVGATDGKTLRLSAISQGGFSGAAAVPVDTSKKYVVRARVRQVTGEGSVYLGVTSKDAKGADVYNTTGGTFSYAGAVNVKLTPDMGWQVFEGAISGEYTPSTGVYDPHKFFAGTKAAAPLLLYNYSNANPAASGIVEVDYMQLIDAATGAVLNPNADMRKGTDGWSGAIAAQNSNTDALSVAQVQALLHADAAHDISQFRRYDQDGRLSWSVDGTGGVTHISYDGNGNPIKRIAYANRLNANDMALFNTGALPTPQADAAHDLVTQIAYDAAGRAVYTVDGTGAVVEQRYDGNGNASERIAYATPLATTQPLTLANIAQQLTTLADPSRDQHTLNRYDAANRLIYTANALGYVTQNVYNNAGSIVRRIAYATPLAVPVTAATDLTAVKTDSADRTTNYVYDAGNRQVYAIDALGGVTQRIYDANGNVTRSIRYATPLAAVTGSGGSWTMAQMQAQLQPDAAHDVTINYVFDAANRLSYSIDALGYVTQSTYDANGNLTQSTRYAQAIGVPVASALSAAQVQALLHADASKDVTERKIYDAANRLAYSINAVGYVKQNQYDGAGQIINTIEYARPAGATGTESSGNQLLNGGFSKIGSDGVPQNWSYSDSGAAADAKGVNLSADWSVGQSVYGEQTYYLHQTGIGPANSYQQIAQTIPVSEGRSYSFSAYVGAHRATSEVMLEWYGADGKLIGTTPATAASQDVNQEYVGGSTLYGYKRVVVTGRAPAGAVRANAILRKENTNPGQADSYLFVTRAQFEEVPEGVSAPSAWKLPTGAGPGINQLSNGGFTSIGTDGVPQGWKYLGSGAQADIKGVNLSADWSVGQSVFGEQTYYLRQTGIGPAGSWQEIYQSLPVAEGCSYSFSAYVGAHRATTEVILEWYGADGKPISAVPASDASQDAQQERVGGSKLDSYKRIVTSGKAPPGAVSVLAILRKNNTYAGQADSYLFATRAQFEEVAAGATAPSDWKPATLQPTTPQPVDYRITRNTYDLAGHLTQQTKAAGTSAAATVSYGYDALGNVTSITNERGYTTTQQFDAAGRKIATAVPLNDGADGQTPQFAVTTTQYDAFGNAVKVTDPLGHAGYFYFDQLNRAVLQVDPLGYVTQTSYTGTGKPAQVTRYANAVSGTLSTAMRPTLVASSADASTSLQYDQNDRLTKSIDAEGGYELYGYDSFGNRISVQNKVLGITTSTYDVRGLLLSETLPITARNSAGVLVPVVKRYSYDARGNRTQMIEAVGLPEQRVTHYSYDQADRMLTQSGDPLSIRTVSGWPTVTPTQSWSYDARGNKTAYTDANGQSTRWYYDAADRKVKELSATGTLSTWNYDAASNMISARIYGDPVAAPVNGAPPQAASEVNCRQTDYTYDKNNRQVQSTVNGATFAQRPVGGTNLNIYTGAIVTARQYDALGNVIVDSDGLGNQTLSYYNAVGKKIAQVDAENYLTVWSRDQNDSAVQETRYANKISTPASPSSSLADLLKSVSADGNDRITTYSYDRLNRLLTQSRLNLVTSSLDAKGALSTATATSTVRYAYDGLGNVTEKTEANGEVTDWLFDVMGRQTRVQSAGFTDFQGTLVRPTTDTVYDGLGNVTQSIARGKTNTDDRVTLYTYDAAGRLNSKATQNVDGIVRYARDAVGNVMEEQIYSKKSDGSARLDVNVTHYDAANREVFRQTVWLVSGDPATGVWSAGDTHEIRYNAYGEIVGRGVNGSSAEFAEYDSQGRRWKTNAGDGATKAYLYDANGNATVLIQSAGADLRNMSLAQILAISQAQGASLDPVVQKAIADGGIHMTVSVYDRRNQLVETYQPTMKSAHNMATIEQFLTMQAGSNFTGGNVTMGPTMASVSRGTAPPAAQGSATVNPSGTVSFVFRQLKIVPEVIQQGGTPQKRVPLVAPTLNSFFDIWIPPGLGNGGGNFHVYLDDNLTSGEFGPVTFDGEKVSYFQAHHQWGEPGKTMTVGLYQDIPGGSSKNLTLIARTTFTIPNHNEEGDGSYTDSFGGMAPVRAPIQIKDQPPSTNRLIVMTRPAGSNQPWNLFNATPVPNSAKGGIDSFFCVDWSRWADGSYEYQYVALDPNGLVLNSEAGLFKASLAAPSMFQTPQPIGGSGQAFLTRDGNLNITQQGITANSVRIRYRHVGSSDAWATYIAGPAGIPIVSGGGPLGPAIASSSTPGWFTMPTTGLSGDYEYWAEPYTGANATGTMLNRVKGTFTPGGNASALTSWTEIPENVAFGGQPANSAAMHINYSVRGGASGSATLVWDAMHQQFNWDASSVAPDRLGNYVIDYSYQTSDAGGAIINAAHGALQLGINPAMLSHLNDALPATITFNPPATNATQLVLQYRIAGSKGAYNTLTLPKTWAGNYAWSVDALRPASGSLSLEYAYSLLDANGQPVAVSGGNLRAEGAIEINADRSGAMRQLQWTVTGLNNTAPDIPNTQAAIHRTQTHNAFGDVDSETDGRTHVVSLAYDTMGQLISKQSPETDVTREDGTTVRARPTTNYYYDAASHLVGVRDANGNLNTQRLLAGFGSASDSRIATEFHADSGSKSAGYDIFGNVRTVTDANGVTSNSYDQAGRLIQVTRPTRLPGTPGSQAGAGGDSYTYDTLGRRISHTNALGQRETTDYDADGRVIRTRSFAGSEITYTYAYDQNILGTGGQKVGGWTKVTTYTDGGRNASDSTDYFNHISSHRDFGGHVVTYSYDYAAHLKHQASSAGQNIDFSYYANGYLKSSIDHVLNVQSYYEYDEEGNRTREAYTSGDAPANRINFQVADIQYDELNRVSDFHDPQAHIQYQYDANNNRRRVLSVYDNALDGAATTQDYWYKYDKQNRFVVTMGQLANGSIVLGTSGVQIGYDAAGLRRSAVYADGHTESYSYTSDGYLEDVQINGVLRSRRFNDQLGRVQNYLEYAADGSTVTYSKGSVFDADSRVTQDTVTQSPVGGTSQTRITNYDYRLDVGGGHYTGDDQGVVTHTYRYDPNTFTGIGLGTDTMTSYVWWDEAKQSQIQVFGTDLMNLEARIWGGGRSDFKYDVNGHLQQVNGYDTDGKGNTTSNLPSRTMVYTSDEYGQVLRRNELSSGSLGVAQRYYYLNGQLIGDVSNNGPSNVSYAEELARRDAQQLPSIYRYGKPVASAEFDQNYQPINTSYPGTTASGYTVKSGDTLASIARATWGDANLWYLIADTNNLNAGATLAAGQRLTLPNKVSNAHNSSATFRVYNPGQAIGDTLPTLPPEPAPPPLPGGGGCSNAQIFAIVLAIVVTYITAGAATQYFGNYIAGSAVGGAAGAAASQGMLIAAGEQNGFDWKGVALGAIGGAVTAGVGEYMPMPAGSSAFTQGVIRGAVSSAVTQGVAVATGLQSHFDWRGVAASALASGINASVADSMGEAQYGDERWKYLNGKDISAAERNATFLNDMGATMTRGAVAGLAGGVASGLVRGGGMQRNFPGILQDVVSGTIGSLVTKRVELSQQNASDRVVAASEPDRDSHDDMRQRQVSKAPWTLPADYVESGDAVQNWANAHHLDAPTTSTGVEFMGMNTQSSFRPGSYGDSYDTFRQGVGSDGVFQLKLTHHLSADERLANWQSKTEDFFINHPDAAASAPDSSVRYLAAATYGIRKISNDIAQSVLSVPRVLTSDTMVPGMVNAVLHPMDTANNAFTHLRQMPLQDQLVFGLEAALPFKGGLEAVAGRIPGAGKFLVGELGYDSGVTLNAGGARYGFVGDGVNNTGLFGTQQGSAGGVKFGRLEPDVTNTAEELVSHTRAAEKGYPGVQVTPNGGPTFANSDYLFPVQDGQRNVLNLEMTGSRRLDFRAANEAAGLQDLVPRGADSPSGYVWHHVDDFNPATGTSTLELVERGAHNATIPHRGSVYQWEQLNGVPYKR